MVKKHPAFDIDTNLTILAKKYDIIINYLPKFHSEFSPIEGVWAYEKVFIRKIPTKLSQQCVNYYMNQEKIYLNIA